MAGTTQASASSAAFERLVAAIPNDASEWCVLDLLLRAPPDAGTDAATMAEVPVVDKYPCVRM